MIIPDQLSLDPAYPGFRDLAEACAIGGRLRISVAGIEQHDVIAYDQVNGVVIRAEHSSDGKVVWSGDEVSLETVRGPVDLEPLSA